MRWVLLAALGVTAGCGSSGATPQNGNSGNGGAGGTGGTASSSSSTAGGSSASSSASSSSGEPTCKVGGEQCAGFAECCSGSCAGGTCEACNATGDLCGNSEGCCVGLTCYNGKCKQCTDDYLDCTLAADCCSGICKLGKCEPIDCMGLMNCYGQCVDTSSDTMHCGGCMAPCAAGDVCCGGVCANLNTNDKNCGDCGSDCGADHHCESGACSINQTCCLDGTNTDEQPANAPLGMGVAATGSYAWRFVAACAMSVVGIELYTNGGSVSIREDEQNWPGVPMGGGTLGNDYVETKWRTANLMFSPLTLVAGNVYWITQNKLAQQTTYASTSEFGADVDYVTRFDNQSNWKTGGTMKALVRLIGDCPP